MRIFVSVIALAATACLLVAGSGSAGGGSIVVVPGGGPIQLAAVLPESGGSAGLGQSARNAVQMAIDAHASIHGFSVQVNDLDGPCGGDVASAHLAAARAVVANTQNVAVIGHYCSSGDKVALPVYEQAGIVAISGSATGDALPDLAPTVFDRTVVEDAAEGASGDAWYQSVQALKSDQAWQAAYAARFGQAPLQYADLYYDATTLLLDRLAQVSTLNRNGTLSIDRAALAAGVRNTTAYLGISCTITLDPSGNRINDQTPHSACK